MKTYKFRSELLEGGKDRYGSTEEVVEVKKNESPEETVKKIRWNEGKFKNSKKGNIK